MTLFTFIYAGKLYDFAANKINKGEIMREKSLGFILWLAVFISYCLFWSKAEENGKTRQVSVICMHN